jgi:hypothetical protein
MVIWNLKFWLWRTEVVIEQPLNCFFLVGIICTLYMFIIYLVMSMQNLHSVILATSQLSISEHCAKKCISISARVQKMHINDITMKMYVTTNNSIDKYFRILSSFTTASLAWKYMINRIIHAKIHITWYISPRAPYLSSGPSVIRLICHAIWILACIILCIHCFIAIDNTDFFFL